MLNTEITRKIEDFIYTKPRSIDEISKLIGKNWRTADRYVQEIEKNFGTISTRVFREGTRGALKIVYWSSQDKASHSVFQEKMENDIVSRKTKYDFSPFDIFQLVKDNKKDAWIKTARNEVEAGRLNEFKNLLEKSQKQILFLSGNLSFINFKDKNVNIFNVIDNLVKKGISIKVICRVDFSGIENIEKMLSLNYKYGKNLVEIRHREQPLRATVIDNKIINLKEIKEPTGREKELDKKTFIIYTINDKEWTEWLSKIFWKMFNNSISAEKRLEELKKLRY